MMEYPYFFRMKL
jgi:hypothetical protein